MQMLLRDRITTDQRIAKQANEKSMLARHFLATMRSAAVDCRANGKPSQRACYETPNATGPILAASIFEEREDKLGTGKVMQVPGDSRQFAVFDGSADVYDARQAEQGVMEPIGEVQKDGGINWFTDL